METSKLKQFAQYARRYLMEQVSAKLKFVLASESAARRENPRAVQEIEKQIAETSQTRAIEKVAYIWFNRFCAFRFMDANRYTSIGIVSPAEGQFQPEILADAKMGHIDEEMVPDATRERIFNLLSSAIPSSDPQQEAYRLLLVATCNHYNKAMPFLFEEAGDYTELLIPDALLSGKSILTRIQEELAPEVCKDIEVIGHLYQYYIAGKKYDLALGSMVTAEYIPAFTQYFTPNWMVRYMVENTLGRLWMLNRPDSRLIERMDYYIKSSEPEKDFLGINNPQDIRLCDPACGSGHILTYAFDLLYAMYEEEGYDVNEISRLILEKNLFGIEIDERAGQLAAFALTMKARQYDKRIFSRKSAEDKAVSPNICILQNINFEEDDLLGVGTHEWLSDSDVSLADFFHDLKMFGEADNFGSLIRPKMLSDSLNNILRIINSKLSGTESPSDRATLKRVQIAVKQISYLIPRYHVVIANPPRMEAWINNKLSTFLQVYYTGLKADLFSAFVIRSTELALPKGLMGSITPFEWMFTSPHGKLREFLTGQKTITSLVQLANNGGLDGARNPICIFTVENVHHKDYKGAYLRLSDFPELEDQPARTREAATNPDCGWLYRAAVESSGSADRFSFAYSISERLRCLLNSQETLKDCAGFIRGPFTNRTYKWHEFALSHVRLNNSEPEQPQANDAKWIPCKIGGEFRRWYGDNRLVIKKSEMIGNHSTCHGIEWYPFTRKKFSGTYFESSFAFAGEFAAFIPKKQASLLVLLAYLNSKVFQTLLDSCAPGIYHDMELITAIPCLISRPETLRAEGIANEAIKLSRKDWDFHETSWDFTGSPLLNPDFTDLLLSERYSKLRIHWQDMTQYMWSLEETNNRIFIKAYGLTQDLKPDVQLRDISLICNPFYRYDGDKNYQEIEALLLADTMKDFISYAVGCMFGRYSLDAPGLILANAGESVEDYFRIVQSKRERQTVTSDEWRVTSEKQKNTNRLPLTIGHSEITFDPDRDNVIPILDEGWFVDDITERFSKFLKVAFGEEHYEENLAFIEKAIGRDIRYYFLVYENGFYSDHLKRYQNKPVYWIFASSKRNFKALIYMHRYQPDTVSIVLNGYLREYLAKISARKDNLEHVSISASASAREKTQALKDIEKLRKMIDELEEYEREIIYPLATKQISIDLDDGVKVNYIKLGDALKKIS